MNRKPDNGPYDKPTLVAALMDAQAELQTGLGFFRLGSQHRVMDTLTEARLSEALGRLHTILGDLGTPMPPRKTSKLDAGHHDRRLARRLAEDPEFKAEFETAAPGSKTDRDPAP